MWGHLQHRFDATPGAPRAARQRLRAWLASLDWSEPEGDDLVLAVSEAVSNAVEHAYHPGEPGEVSLTASTLTDPTGIRRLSITITDFGTWHHRRPVTGPRPAISRRGRGLALMRAITEQVRIDTSATGTRLTLISHPVRRSTAANPG